MYMSIEYTLIYYITLYAQGRIQGGARGALAPPHDCKIYDLKIENMVKSAKHSISIIGRVIL